MIKTNTLSLTDEEVEFLYQTLDEHLGEITDLDVDADELSDAELNLLLIFNKVEKIYTQINYDLGEFDPDKDADEEDADEDNENPED